MNKLSVSMIIPVYNEEENIEELVLSCYKEILNRSADTELIIIDDASTDNTKKILQDLEQSITGMKLLENTSNMGHGASILKGYNSASKDYVFQLDSDNQFRLSDFWRLFEYAGDFNFIVGYRKKRYDSFHRFCLSKLIQICDFLLFGVWIKDVNSPFRLMRTDFLKQILKEIDPGTLAPNILISIYAKKNKLKFREVPVKYYRKNNYSSSFSKKEIIKFSYQGLKQLYSFKKKLNKKF